MSKINTKRLIEVVAISFILIICPAASWYYLQKGLDYQKESRKELSATSTLDVSTFIPEFIKQDSTLLNNKLRLLILNESNNQNEVAEISTKLVDQFEESKGLFIIELIKSSVTNIPQSLQKNTIQISKVIDQSEFQNISANVIGSPVYEEVNGKKMFKELDKNIPSSGDAIYAYLIDQHDKVRNVYDLLNEDRVKRMVEHIAILIPRQNKEEVVLIREKEM